MKRKDFLQISSALAAIPFVSPLSSFEINERLQNWAGNLTYSTDNVFYPSSVSELQSLVIKTDSLRALGTRHCFNTIADSQFNLISSNKLNQFISIDETRKTVTVEGGIKYGELAPLLDKKGYALQNLASLPHISVAGSISTATHGSGVTNGNLATQVRGLQIIVADGSVVNLTAENDGEIFQAAVVGLGAFGFITKVELAIEPSYQVRQNVFKNASIRIKKSF